MSDAGFDPYVLLEALERERTSYVVIGAFARVVNGSGETTGALDIVPSLRDENLRRVGRALDDLDARSTRRGPASVETLAAGEPTGVRTSAGSLKLVPTPWGTRGYDDLRIRANRENLGRGLRPSIASTVDLVRMLEASTRAADIERLLRLRRMMELEHELVRSRRLSRGLSIER